MKCVWDCHKRLLEAFYSYGYFLGSHPYWFLIIPLVVFGGLASGFIFYNPESDIELFYTPIDSRAVKSTHVVVDTFRDMSTTNYDPCRQNRLVTHGVVIFRSVQEKAILTDTVLADIFFSVYNTIKYLHKETKKKTK